MNRASHPIRRAPRVQAFPAPGAVVSRGQPLGYRYPPIPQRLFDEIAADRLKPRPPVDPPAEWQPGEPAEARARSWKRERNRLMRRDRLQDFDAHLMAELLRYKPLVSYARWATKSYLARQRKCSPRRVQYALRRLIDRKFLTRQIIPIPDPDDPRNENGFRYLLPFGAGFPETMRDAPDPFDRRPTEPRKAPAADVLASAPAPAPVPAPVEPTRVDQAAELVPDVAPIAVPDPGPVEPAELVELPQGVDEAVEAAGLIEGHEGNVAAEIRADHPRIGRQIQGRWDLLAAALFLVVHLMTIRPKGKGSIRNPLRYAIKTAADFVSHGTVSEEAVRAKASVLKRHREAEAQRIRLAAAMTPAPPEPETPPSEEEIAKARSWERGEDGPAKVRLGALLLAEYGLPPEPHPRE